MINNIIFDFGGVICDNKKREHFLSMGTGPADIDWVEQNLWHVYTTDENTGKLSNTDVIRIACEKYPSRADLIKFMYDDKTHLPHALPLRFDVLDYITELRARGFHVWGLTNMNPTGHKCFCEQYRAKRGGDFDKLFDGVTYSYRVGLVKPNYYFDSKNPDIRIYEKFLQTWKIDPKTAIFIDDSKNNITTGELAGIRGIQWTPTDTLETIRQKLEKLLR